MEREGGATFILDGKTCRFEHTTTILQQWWLECILGAVDRLPIKDDTIP